MTVEHIQDIYHAEATKHKAEEKFVIAIASCVSKVRASYKKLGLDGNNIVLKNLQPIKKRLEELSGKSVTKLENRNQEGELRTPQNIVQSNLRELRINQQSGFCSVPCLALWIEYLNRYHNDELRRLYSEVLKVEFPSDFLLDSEPDNESIFKLGAEKSEKEKVLVSKHLQNKTSDYSANITATKSWRSALNEWEVTHDRGQPVNGKLANFSIEPQQTNRTDQPIGFYCEVYLGSAVVEYESGKRCKIKFKSVVLETEIHDEGVQHKSHPNYTDNLPQVVEEAEFVLDSTSGYPFVVLKCNDGIDGRFVSSKIFEVIPNSSTCKVSSTFSIPVIETEVSFPENLKTDSVRAQPKIKLSDFSGL